MIDSAVRAVHARGDLNAAVRYSAVRLAELLDPATPFALSGAAYCDPLAATRAFESAARDYGVVVDPRALIVDATATDGPPKPVQPGFHASQ